MHRTWTRLRFWAVVIMVALGLVACAAPMPPQGLPMQQPVAVDRQWRRFVGDDPVRLKDLGAIYPNEWSRWLHCVQLRRAKRGGLCSVILRVP